MAKDRFVRLADELSEVRKAVVAIVNSAYSRMSDCHARVRSVVAAIAAESERVATDDGIFAALLKLDRELNARIDDLRKQNAETIRMKETVNEEFKAEIARTRAKNKELLEMKGAEVLEFAQNGHCALNELLKAKSDVLRRIRDGHRKIEDAVVSNSRQLKHLKVETGDRLALELTALAEQKK